MFGGFSLLYVVTYGYLAWTPALFIRTHEMDMATVGLLLGAANVVAGVSGNILGGWTCDRWIARGSSDAEIRIGMVSAAILLPLCIAVPIVPDADLAIGLLAALIFVAHFWRSEEHTSELQSLMRIS